MRGLPPELVDMLVREYALRHARTKMEGSRGEAIAEKARLETNPGLLMSLSGKGKREREEGIKAALDYKSYYDSQLGKVESLISLLNKEIGRWLDCCLKMRSPDYCVGLAAHDFPEDWGRYSYNFEVLIRAFQMGLQDLMVLYKGESLSGPRSEPHNAAVRKLLPTARLVEIDVEFLNKILAQQARRKGAGAAAQHPEYGWCETLEQLAGQPVKMAIETLRELVGTSSGFLPSLVQEIKREHGLAEERVALGGRKTHPSYLKLWWEGLKPAAAQGQTGREPEAMIAETEALLLDGNFAARFNRYLLSTIVRGPAQAGAEKAAVATPAVADAELKAMKEKLDAELEDVAKLKANLTRRERTLREGEQAFEEKRQREQAAIDEGLAKLAAREEELARKAREWEERYVAEQARLEALIAENNERVGFIDESEQRLLAKGQEQIERLAELEQQEEELESTKRELNEMRKEMGLPIVPLRSKPVDEFSE